MNILNKNIEAKELFKLNQDQNPYIFSIKGIAFDNNGYDVLKSKIETGHMSGELIVMNPNQILLEYGFDKLLINVKQMDDGYEYTVISSYRNEDILKFLFDQRGIENYIITDKVGGINNHHEETLIVEISTDHFIHLPQEFLNMGYLVKPRL